MNHKRMKSQNASRYEKIHSLRNNNNNNNSIEFSPTTIVSSTVIIIIVITSSSCSSSSKESDGFYDEHVANDQRDCTEEGLETTEEERFEEVRKRRRRRSLRLRRRCRCGLTVTVQSNFVRSDGFLQHLDHGVCVKDGR